MEDPGRFRTAVIRPSCIQAPLGSQASLAHSSERPPEGCAFKLQILFRSRSRFYPDRIYPHFKNILFYKFYFSVAFFHFLSHNSCCNTLEWTDIWLQSRGKCGNTHSTNYYLSSQRAWCGEATGEGKGRNNKRRGPLPPALSKSLTRVLVWKQVGNAENV